MHISFVVTKADGSEHTAVGDLPMVPDFYYQKILNQQEAKKVKGAAGWLSVLAGFFCLQLGFCVTGGGDLTLTGVFTDAFFWGATDT